MCLYIGSKNKFVAKHDIIVYKNLFEVSKGEWVTPFRRWPIEFNKALIPKGAAREKKREFKHIIEEGAIHAYTSSPDSKTDCEKVFIAKIPAGTIFWLQDDLEEVAAKKMIITTEHPKPGERTNLSEYYYLGVDVYLKDGSRAKNNENFSVSDVIGLFAFDNRVISTKVEDEIFSSCNLVDQKNEYSYIDIFKKAKRDMDGYTNTKSLEKYLKDHPAIDICKKLGEDWYLPALGELIKTFSNLLYINLTLRKLNLPIIDSGWFWSSSVPKKECAWGYDSYSFPSWNYYKCCVIGRNSVLPFLKLS